MPMNDPHVEAIHYFVQHDGSVDYSGAEPLVYDDGLFRIRAEQRHVVLEPKCHYATEQKAKSAAEGFVRRWEFEAALQARSSAFRLVYERVDIVDRKPPPLPPGIGQPSSVYWSIHVPEVQGTVTKNLATYPAPSSGSALDPDDRDVKSMLYRLDLCRMGREPLASVAYFCLTMLEDSALQVAPGKPKKRQAAANHYQIEMCVLNRVGKLSSEKGGDEARKAQGRSDSFTQEESRFLGAAVAAFIRRAAEKAADPDRALPCITMANLLRLPSWTGA